MAINESSGRRRGWCEEGNEREPGAAALFNDQLTLSGGIAPQLSGGGGHKGAPPRGRKKRRQRLNKTLRVTPRLEATPPKWCQPRLYQGTSLQRLQQIVQESRVTFMQRGTGGQLLLTLFSQILQH